MKFTKHNNANRKQNKKSIEFDDVRSSMTDDGHVFGVDYEFVNGEVVAFTRAAYLTAKDSGFSVDYLADDKQ